MAKAYRARAIVLSHTKLGETDCIVTMLDENGIQIRAVAKGLRKPGNRIGARLEPYSLVDVLLHPGKSLDIVGEVSCVRSNETCREGLERAAAASVIAEFLEKLTRDGASCGARVFSLTLAAFEALCHVASEQCALYCSAHLMKAMAMQGLRPQTRSCVLCGAPVEHTASFDVGAGGTLCEACAPQGQGPMLQGTLGAWVETLLCSTFAQLGTVSRYPACELLTLCELWMREYLSLNLRSVTFLKQLFSGTMDEHALSDSNDVGSVGK